MKKDFIPKGEGDLLQFLLNLNAHIASPPAGFVIPAALQTAISDACQALPVAADAAKQAEDAYHAAVQQKLTTKTNSIKAIREAVKDLQRLPNYDAAIAKALGVVGDEFTPEYANLKPAKPKAKRVIKGVQITYVRGYADGALIYGRRGAETAFTLVGQVNKTVFIDTRTNIDGASAENREYYLVFFKNDDPIGISSDIFIVKA